MLRTMIETDRVPVRWRKNMERFDEVWPRYLRDTWRRASATSWIPPEEIRIVPPCLDTSVFRPEGEAAAAGPELAGRFVFLSERIRLGAAQGSQLLIESYCREFPADSEVGLLLKLTRTHGDSL